MGKGDKQKQKIFDDLKGYGEQRLVDAYYREGLQKLCDDLGLDYVQADTKPVLAGKIVRWKSMWGKRQASDSSSGGEGPSQPHHDNYQEQTPQRRLEIREREVGDRERTVEQREREFESAVQALKQKSDQKRQALTNRETSLKRREEAIEQQTRSLQMREDAVAQNEATLEWKKGDLREKGESVTAREIAVAQREVSVEQKEGEVHAREESVTAREIAVAQREVSVEQKEGEVHAREESVTAREIAVAQREESELPQSFGDLDLDDARSSVPQVPYETLVRATDDFSQDRIIGEGGCGRVYRGEIGHTQIAVKKLEIDSEIAQLQGAPTAEQIATEVGLLSRVQHPNIVQLAGFCSDPPCLAYQYVEGGSLRKHLDANSLQPHERIRILADASLGLEYICISANVIHRDVKSDNILIDSEGRGKLGDFGIAHVVDQLDRSGNPTTRTVSMMSRIVGTPYYLAPEYSQSGTASFSMDVYAFGIVILEVLTGMQPKDCQTKFVEDEYDLDSVFDSLKEAGGARWVREDVEILLALASECLQQARRRRPVVSRLHYVLSTLLQQALARLGSPENETSLSADAHCCKICYDGPLNTVLSPCRHVCACNRCADELQGKTCPICRSPIEEISTVHIA